MSDAQLEHSIEAIQYAITLAWATSRGLANHRNDDEWREAVREAEAALAWLAKAARK